MIAVRDILIFSSLVLIAVVFIATLFPMREGVSPVPACSDCAFKLTGPYVLVQYGNYAAVQLGERQLARYGWAYVDGEPLRPGDAASCYPDPMYLWVIGGVAYASCRGEPQIGSSYSVNYTAPAVTVVVRDSAKAGWSVQWSGSASGSRAGVGDASWQILTAGPITLRASSKCRVEPPSATARPGDAVVFAVRCVVAFSDPLDYSSKPPHITERGFGTWHVQYSGYIRTAADACGGSALSSVIYNIAQRVGRVKAAGANITITGVYSQGDIRNNVAYLSVGVDEDGDGGPDRELIYYVYDTSEGDGAVYSVLVSPGTFLAYIRPDGSPDREPPSEYALNKAGGVRYGDVFTIRAQLPNIDGYITHVAFAVVDAEYCGAYFAVDWRGLRLEAYT